MIQLWVSAYAGMVTHMQQENIDCMDISFILYLHPYRLPQSDHQSSKNKKTTGLKFIQNEKRLKKLNNKAQETMTYSLYFTKTGVKFLVCINILDQ